MSAEPSIVQLLRDLIAESGDYGHDLARLFAAELREQSRSIRYVAAMAATAMLLLFTGFLFLTGSLVGAIAFGLGSWPWALFIVGIAYGIIGLLLLVPLGRGISSGLLRFEHTRRRLKRDSEWIKQKLAA